MFEKKYIIFSLLIIIIVVIFVIMFGHKPKEENNYEKINDKINTIIDESNIYEESDEVENVIKNSFKYRNEHDLDKTLELYIDRYKDSDFRLDNLESIEIIELKLLTDKSQYRQYINNIILNESDLKIKAIKIYEVKYYVEYKDETLEPNDSGEIMKQYCLIKLQDSDKWLIHGVGNM